MPQTHPSPANLRAFALGKLPPPEAQRVEAHLAECDECTQHLVAAPDDTLVQLAREAATESMYAVKPSASSVAGAPAAPAELVDHPRYKLRGPLGSGGMGTVYKAEHRLMERFVALKVIRRGLTSSPQAVERFRREVKAAAKLSHPNIVAALDAEQAGDLHFLVMEYVDGISLDRLLAEKGTLTPRQACSLIYEASKGLAHAHDKGMIHRDIKPQNLMVTRGKNQVKILDFGLARLAVQSQLDFDLGDATEKSGDAAKTMAGMFLGTPDYIAPEQARDPRLADARSDIYSLGCTLYFLLTGGPPFPNGTAEQKLASHFSVAPTPVTSLRDDVSPELAAVLERMMAKDPGARYSTVAEVTKALQPFTKSAPATAVSAAVPPEPPPIALPVVVAKSPTPPVVQTSPTLANAANPRNDSANRPWLMGAIGIGATALLLAFVLNLLGFFSSNVPSPARPATGKVLFVIPNANVWYGDYGPVKKRLEQGGLTVVTASVVKGPCLPGQDPLNYPNPPPVVADLSIYDVDPRGYDAILFCGAGIQAYNEGGSDGPLIARLLADFQADRKVIGAICLGQAVPASHGLLDGKEAAGGNLMRNKYNFTGPNWINSAVAVADSGRLITGRDDQAALPFADAVLKSLGR